MSKRTRFSPNETPTDPDLRSPKGASVHTSGRAPKSRRERSEAPTIPPPRSSGPKSSPKGAPNRTKRTEPAMPRARPRPPERPEKKPADKRRDERGAAVDEVVADLSKDPRRERD